MTATNVSMLKVPGASLYHEVRGSGPALLMISGGPTDAGIFSVLADLLADRYTVVTYDPRGHSRSVLDGPPEDVPIALHADDAGRLLQAVAGEPANVFGSSGGAVIGLDLVTRRPELVNTFVAHEPPVMELLADNARWRATFQEVYDTYRTNGVFAAIQTFGAAVEEGGPKSSDQPQERPSPEQAELMSRLERNFEFFVAHEIRAIGSFVPDIAALHASSTRVVVGGGEESGTQGAYRAAVALAERLGTDLAYFPGGHGGFGTHPDAFAAKLHETLGLA
jgi:pimeloyl-ACP methyl ester carboxylesterase